MKWVPFVLTALLTALLQISAIWRIEFMHNATANITFLTVSLFIGLILHESSEDMPVRIKKIFSGFMSGTYISAAVISFLTYQQYLRLYYYF